MSHRRIIQFLLEEFSKCFDDDNNRFRQHEILSLSEILTMP